MSGASSRRQFFRRSSKVRVRCWYGRVRWQGIVSRIVHVVGGMHSIRSYASRSLPKLEEAEGASIA